MELKQHKNKDIHIIFKQTDRILPPFSLAKNEKGISIKQIIRKIKEHTMSEFIILNI